MRGEGRGVPVDVRFWSRVDKSGDCWEWVGARTTPDGYGILSRGGPGRNMVTANRLSWELHFGPIPDGLLVLHACDNRACVRPDHLMLGTFRANAVDAGRKRRLGTARDATHCKRGHSFAENTYIHPSTGRRMCRACHIWRSAEYRERHRGAA